MSSFVHVGTRKVRSTSGVQNAFPRPACLTAGCSVTTEGKKLSGVKGVKSTLSRLDVNNGRGAMRG
ncbi:hypothetical protein J6590_050168 [Homalodisca vitripennis]|nr:hypothetical protein J6590_050168 [Homalodisca vitripennis]